MRNLHIHAVFPLLLLLPSAAVSAEAPYTIPISYYKLDNGLKVVLSKDAKAPLVTVAVYYGIGFRVEPKNRTGFAHLFEHMMFQGSSNLPKGEFDKLTNGSGGINNGSTRFDFTNYFEVVPSHALEPMLWAEADRMKGLLLTPANLKNQQGVVSNEVLGNVLNQPYGGFPWLDMPQYANTNWYNAHNFYGDLKDLEAATLTDVQEFFRLYYSPNNAVLSVVGDFDEAQAKQWVKKYFAGIPSAPRPAAPDLAEPKQTEEKRASKTDKLANRPALAVAYHVPERNTPEHLGMVLLASILGEGDDALLKEEIIKKKGFTGSVGAGINLLGDAFNYKGPMLWTVSLFHDATTPVAKILESIDSVIADIQEKGVTKAQVDRALVKFRSRWYANMSNGIGRADMISSFALFDDAPEKVNQVEANMRSVTPDLIRKVAKEYLRTTNRTILTIVPEKGAAGN